MVTNQAVNFAISFYLPFYIRGKQKLFKYLCFSCLVMDMANPKFFRRVLKNGMTILFEKRNSGIVSVAFATRYGGINENLNEKGIAHFIEHMLYKGTRTRDAKKISEEIEKRGGVMNGFTSEEITAYWCKMPSNHLNTALEVLSDMIKNPLFDKKEMKKEKKVIFEEIKMCKDTPHLHASEEIMSCLYKGTLGLRLIGNEKTLSPVNRKILVKKFRQVYTTNNLILCVIGDANFEEICNFAEKNFPKTISELPEQDIIAINKTFIEKRKGIDQANIIFAYHVPSALKKENYAAQILSALMAEGMSSKLFQEIREKKNLAYAIKGSCDVGRDFGHNTIFIGTSKENVEKVKKIILEEFAKIKKLNQKELKEVKEQLIGNNKIAKEDSQSQMLDLLGYEILGKASEAYEFEEKISAVKLDEVKKLANFKKYSFFALVPE